MATSGGKCLQHHRGLYHLKHRLSHLRDEERVRENWWYQMSLFFEENLLVTKVQAGRQPHSSWCLNQAWPAPSRDHVGGLPSPEAAVPRLPNNPSKRPGKKLLSRGLSAARPTKMSGTTSGCLRGSLRSN